MMNRNNFSISLKNWANKHLTPGKCYGSNRDVLLSDESDKLVYQDGTACSASFAFSDVYLQDNSYLVVTDCGAARFTGDDPLSGNLIKENCQNIIEVFDELLQFCGHDPNSVGDLNRNLVMFLNLDKKHRFISFKEIEKYDNPGIIKAINEFVPPCY